VQQRSDLDSIRVPEGCGLGVLLSQGAYARIHYTSDPSKRDSRWIQTGRVAMGAREWDREMEMREDVWDGLPVFPEYQDDRHAPQEGRAEKFKAHMDRTLYLAGWDAGQTLRPAFALAQLVFGDTRQEFQLQGLMEVVTEFPLPMETFAPLVNQAVYDHYPEIAQRIEHFGDDTIRQRSGSRGETAQMVANEHGIWISPMPNQWEPRKSAVSWFLKKSVGEEQSPAMVLNGLMMPTLRKAFQGAYCLESKDDTVGMASVLKMPVKNGYSHVSDAWQYLCLAAKREIESGGEKTTELQFRF